MSALPDPASAGVLPLARGGTGNLIGAGAINSNVGSSHD